MAYQWEIYNLIFQNHIMNNFTDWYNTTCVIKHLSQNRHTYTLIDCIQMISSILMNSDITNESITNNAHVYVYVWNYQICKLEYRRIDNIHANISTCDIRTSIYAGEIIGYISKKTCKNLKLWLDPSCILTLQMKV